MKILLIEDHAAVAAVSINLLREVHEHEVEHACSAAAAFTLMPAFRPDLVLLDLNLPDLDGYEVAARLRADRTWDAVILVALSGFGSEIDSARAAACGIDAQFRKPMDFGVLPQLRRAVAGRENARQPAH